MGRIKDSLDALKEKDVYSLALFCLYKIIGAPEYSSIGELAYVLDKKNLLNLCEYFGGQTITIPTIGELENLLHALLLYQYVKIENIPYEKAVDMIKYHSKDMRAVKNNYHKLSTILDDYSFQVRADIEDV